MELSPDGAPRRARLSPATTRGRTTSTTSTATSRSSAFDDGHSIVTVAAAVDVGSSVTQFLFGKKVQDVILSTPHAMRAYFAQARDEAAAPLVATNR